jgi:hypothetical protein
MENPVHMIERTWRGLVLHRGPDWLAGNDAGFSSRSRFARADSFSGSARLATWSWQVEGATGSTLQIGSTP